MDAEAQKKLFSFTSTNNSYTMLWGVYQLFLFPLRNVYVDSFLRSAEQNTII